MAFTVSTIVEDVWGKHRVKKVRVTADAATGSFDTGNFTVLDAHYTIENVASAPTMNLPVLALNAGVTGTSIAGTISLTNCVSGGIYRLEVVTGS